ncbi:MAG: GNAT family N-acetyltransferase [Thermomicrobiales bacterium]
MATGTHGHGKDDPAGALWLRRAAPADAALIWPWRNEPSVGRYQPILVTGVDELGRSLAAQASRSLDTVFVGTARFIIETPSGPAGWITLREVNREHRLGDIGYTIGEACRGRGYASAAVRRLLPIAFEDLALDRLGAVAATDNIASRRVLERTGFVFEGVMRSYLIINGQRVDHARYALLRADWEAGRQIGKDCQELS